MQGVVRRMGGRGEGSGLLAGERRGGERRRWHGGEGSEQGGRGSEAQH